MITFYKADETDFDNNGLGVLDHDIQNPDIEEKLNDIFTFSFNYPIFAVNGARLAARMIVKADDPENSGQLFRILKLSKSNGMLTAFCYHIFYDLNGNEIPDTNIVGQNGQTAITQMLSKTAVAHKFQGFSDIAETANIRVVRMSPVKFLIDPQTDNNFINRLGGEIRRVNYRIWMNKVRGSDNGATIRWKKSLDSYNATWDYTTIATRIRPVGYNGIMLPESYVDSPLIDKYETIAIKEIQYSDIKAIDPNATSNDETAVPLEEAYELLRQAAAKEFSGNNLDKPTVTLSVNMVALRNMDEYKDVKSLETINPWDTVTVINERDGLSVKVRLNHYHWNPVTHKFISMELGNAKSTFTDIGSKVDHATNLANQANDTANTAAESANGKNSNYHGPSEPSRPVDGDLWYKKNGDKTELWQYDGKSVPPGWKLVVDDATGEEVRQNVDVAQKEAEEAQKTANESVAAANDAVAKAGFANDTATQAKSDAATAKADAATAKGQATNALGQANTAIANAANAINAATDAQTKTNSLVTKVDDIAGTIKTLATTETVDQLAGTVATTQSLAQFAADGLKLKADTTTVNQINGTVNDLKGELDVQADKIAATVTASDVTGMLGNYATQTWSQGQISAAKNEITASVETVNQKVNAMTGDPDNLIIGGDFEDQREYIGKPSPYWSGLNTIANNGDKIVGNNPSATVLQINGLVSGNNDVTGLNLVAIEQKEYNVSLKTRWISATQLGQIIIYAFEYDANKNLISHPSIQIDKTPSGWKSVGATYKPSSDKVRYAALDITYNGAKSADVAIYVDDVRMRLALATTEWTKSQLNVAVGKISADVQTLTSDMATQTWTQGKINLTADSLTSQISSVKNGLDTKYTRLEQNLSGVQVTANNAVTQSQYTQLAGQITSVIGGMGQKNLITNTDFNDLSEWTFGRPEFWRLGTNQYDSYKGSNTLYFQGISNTSWTEARSNAIPVAEGETISVSAILFATGSIDLATPTGVVQIEVDFYDTIDGPKQEPYSKKFNNADPYAKQLLKIDNIKVPASRKFVRFLVYVQAGAQIVIAHPMLVKDTFAGEYQPNTVSESQITQLQDDINLRVQKGDVINQINISPESILIAGQKVHITGQTTIDNAVIKDAMIADIKADKITAGTLNAANVNVINLNANNITTGTLKGANLSMNLNTGEVLFQKGAIRSTNGNLNIDVNDGTLSIADSLNRGVIFRNGIMSLSDITYGSNVASKYGTVSFEESIIGSLGTGMKLSGAHGTLVGMPDYHPDSLFSPTLQFPTTGGVGISKNYLNVEAARIAALISGKSYLSVFVTQSPTVQVGAALSHTDGTAWTLNTGSGPETESGSNVWANGKVIAMEASGSNTGSTGISVSDLSLAVDGRSGYVLSTAAYNRTYGAGSTAIISTNGVIGRISSASKYKLAINKISTINDDAHRFLSVKPKQWFDKSEIEIVADTMTTGNNDYVDDAATLPHMGYVAEDLYTAGLDNYVLRGHDGSIESIQYDRLPVLHHELIRELFNRLDAAELEIYKLKQEANNAS